MFWMNRKHDLLVCPTRNISNYRYNFEIDPRGLGAKVVLSADESTYVGKLRYLESNPQLMSTDDAVHKFDHGSPHPIGMQSRFQICCKCRCDKFPGP